jgi:hypothetical protein
LSVGSDKVGSSVTPFVPLASALTGWPSQLRAELTRSLGVEWEQRARGWPS